MLLNIRNLNRDILLNLVIHNNNRACHNMITLPLFLGYILLHQETNSLRPIGKAIIITN